MRATDSDVGPCRAGKALQAPMGRRAPPNAIRADPGARDTPFIAATHAREMGIVHRRAPTTACVHAALLHCCAGFDRMPPVARSQVEHAVAGIESQVAVEVDGDDVVRQCRFVPLLGSCSWPALVG